MVRSEFTFPSADGMTDIHAVEWVPDGPVRAVVQISHGLAEHVLRYAPLAAWLTERGFAAAGLDVTNPEPLPGDHPLLGLPNVTVTPHMASATEETRDAMAVVTAQNILAALAGEDMPSRVR